MKAFTNLFTALDQTNKTSEKVAAIEQYFRAAPPADAAWGLHFLSGGRLRGAVTTRAMREAAMAASGLPAWMLDECYEAAGDLSETIALTLPDDHTHICDLPLHEVVGRLILPLVGADAQRTRDLLTRAWRGMDQTQRFVYNKLVRGNFRLGVQRALVLRGLAEAIGVDAPILAHRISGGFKPTAQAFAALAMPGAERDPARPYPFCLAHQLGRPTDDLGPAADWQIEYKLDGIRAQILRRDGLPRGVAIWSRGEEPIEQQFPEIAAAARALPIGTVLDGEILAWRFGAPSGRLGGRPLSFNALQKRLNRKDVQPTLFDAEGVMFAAFDILEYGGRDVRTTPLRERRTLLEAALSAAPASASNICLPAALRCANWGEALAARTAARDAYNAEGIMLKHLGSHYHPGRSAGGTAASSAGDGGAAAGWWKWKVDPFSVDAVLMYAQQGTGKRAGLFTDYTFGIWHPDPSGKLAPPGELVAFAKAYSGLDDDEIKRVDRFIRTHTLGRKGPVSVVRPELVFEIAFESIRESPRHKAGIAVRFPRILRWRTDKPATEADTLARVRGLMTESIVRDERQHADDRPAR